MIAEWITRQVTSRVTLTIDDLWLAFLQHAESYYRHKDGTPTGEANNMCHALKFLVQAHGQSRAREFGPIKLKQVRKLMIDSGMCRTNINRTIHRVKRVRMGCGNRTDPTSGGRKMGQVQHRVDNGLVPDSCAISKP